MDRLLLKLQSLIWPSVIATALSVLTVLTALLAPDKGTLVLALGLSAVTWACLAQTM
jgi:predicted anti-sigma-YlaC factor YlaD